MLCLFGRHARLVHLLGLFRDIVEDLPDTGDSFLPADLRRNMMFVR
jgi:hypothetical protein